MSSLLNNILSKQTINLTKDYHREKIPTYYDVLLRVYNKKAVNTHEKIELHDLGEKMYAITWLANEIKPLFYYKDETGIAASVLKGCLPDVFLHYTMHKPSPETDLRHFCYSIQDWINDYEEQIQLFKDTPNWDITSNVIHRSLMKNEMTMLLKKVFNYGCTEDDYEKATELMGKYLLKHESITNIYKLGRTGSHLGTTQAKCGAQYLAGCEFIAHVSDGIASAGPSLFTKVKAFEMLMVLSIANGLGIEGYQFYCETVDMHTLDNMASVMHYDLKFEVYDLDNSIMRRDAIVHQVEMEMFGRKSRPFKQ